jgi:hypothetical protein
MIAFNIISPHNSLRLDFIAELHLRGSWNRVSVGVSRHCR